MIDWLITICTLKKWIIDREQYMENITYEQAVEYIINIPRFNKYIDSSYKPNEALKCILEKLGNPHLKVRSIHVAGTNGKGSTVQLVKNILVESGYRVGCFVSPHLIRINERISFWDSLDEKLDNTYISDEDFVEAYKKVKVVCDGAVETGMPNLTFFEYVFAIAAVYFANQDLDYCIYETGLGGRLDATNTLNPELVIITAIGLDHMKLLGDTIEKIAKEKAGIIKTGVPVVYNTGNQEADAVIEQVAKANNSPLIKVEKDCYKVNDIVPKSIDFSCFSSYYRYHNIILNTDGIYQVQNAHTAICACNALMGADQAISEDMVKNACSKFFWQGRMEELDSHLIIDGAHNLNAIVPFVQSVKARLGLSRGVNILFAVADDKNYEDMIEYMCDNLKLSYVYVTAIESDRRVQPEKIAEIFRTYLRDSDVKIVWNNDLKNIFSQAYKKAREEDEILYCVGSLYLIGSIKEYSMEEFKYD